MDQNRNNNTWKKIQGLNVVYSLPFWYGAITRLPFIYFVVHMRVWFEMSWLSIGFFVGSYQATRAVANFVAVFAHPLYAHIVGTSIALAGNLIVLFSDNNQKVPFLVGTVAVGFAEHLAAMQTYLKHLVTSDLDALEYKLKVQYATLCVGVTFTFCLGGVVYQFFGIDGIACFSTILCLFELASIFVHVILSRILVDDNGADDDLLLEQAKRTFSGTASVEGTLDDQATSVGEICTETSMSLEISRPNVANDPEDPTSSLNTNSQGYDWDESLLDAMSNYFSESGMGATYVNYILCLTFGMESITIGYVLAITPIFILQQFQKSEGIVGIMLGAGAAVGTLTSILITLSKRGNRWMKNFAPSPYNFLIAMSGIAVAVWMAGVHSFAVHLIGLLLLMGFNDLAAMLLHETQGAVTSSTAYDTIAPTGQVVRRCFNVVTAVTGPLLFSIYPSLPYIVAGFLTALWTSLLALVIRHRMKKNHEILQVKLKNYPGTSGSKTNFIRQEIRARVAKRLVLTRDGFTFAKNRDNLTGTEQTFVPQRKALRKDDVNEEIATATADDKQHDQLQDKIKLVIEEEVEAENTVHA